MDMNRRQFMTASVAALTPMIIPSGVMAWGGRLGANDRIVTAHIGLGNRGLRLISENPHTIAAMCDVDLQRLEKVAGKHQSAVEVFQDYRALLDRRDIDAVIIATPNHWHALQAIHAIEAGKDVYLAGPLCHSLHEGPTLTRVVRSYDAVLASDAMLAVEDFVQANDLLYDDESSSRVESIEMWAPSNPTGGDTRSHAAPPRHIDWRMWLGPSPWHPYHPDLLEGGFQWTHAFGGGRIAREGVVQLAAALRLSGIQTLDKVAVEIQKQSTQSGLWDVSPELKLVFSLENAAVKLNWQQPAGKDEDVTSGIRVVSEQSNKTYTMIDGCLYTSDATDQILDSDRDRYIQESVGIQNRLLEWGKAIRQRDTRQDLLPYIANTATLIALAGVATRLHRSLVWDETHRQFIGDRQADRFTGQWGALPNRIEGLDIW